MEDDDVDQRFSSALNKSFLLGSLSADAAVFKLATAGPAQLVPLLLQLTGSAAEFRGTRVKRHRYTSELDVSSQSSV